MRFINHTTVSDEFLREVIKFTCPPGVHGFDIAFKNSSRGYRGRAYTKGTCYHSFRTKSGKKIHRMNVPYIVIGRWTNQGMWRKPYAFAQGKGYLGVKVFSDEEALVHLVAHELRHLWQERVKSGRRVWGSRGQFSERDADAYGLSCLRKWRRRKTLRCEGLSASRNWSARA